METKETERKGLGKHGLIMLLCCLIPLAILGVLWAVGVPGNYLVWGVLLLCPVLHIVMMRGMGKDGGHQH
ncbi:MAG: DUF2933 domain-containing protein [Chloroflexi bacterium]|nr:DUF2933 domain-containing protein [Chloroflexota bacterium]